MSAQYVHLELNKESDIGIGRYYTPLKEVRLKYNDREVLYVLSKAEAGCSCCGCGSGSWLYAIVPGYIVNWQNKINEAGLPTSEVEPVSDKEAQNKIREIIQESNVVTSIDFWRAC